MHTRALQIVPCQRCGASLPVEPERPEMLCAFCGTRSATPTNVQAAVAPMQAAVDIETESLSAMRAVLVRHFAPKASEQVAKLFAVMVVGVGVIVVGLQIGFAVGTNVIGVLGFAAGLGIILFGLFFGLLGGHWSADRKASKALEQLRTQTRQQDPRGSCPSCGAATQVPHFQATLTCRFCNATLLAAEGMLIAWTNDATERARRWQQQTAELLKRVELTEKVSGCLAPIVWLVSTFLVVALLGALTFAVRLVLGLD